MIPKHYSQAGQDLFALHASKFFNERTFLDVGCEDGVTINNTLLLEENGWKGCCVDRDAPIIQKCRKSRKAPCLVRNATNETIEIWPRAMGCLSLDVDDDSSAALVNIQAQGFSFKVITAEHDAYRRGDDLRSPMRQALSPNYSLICSNVHHDAMPFEDWWVAKEIAHHFDYLVCDGFDWREIIERLA